MNNLNASEISISERLLTISELNDKISSDDIDLANVWDTRLQSSFIESILIRIPIPAIYINASTSNAWVIIDGSSRVCALYDFIIRDEFSLCGMQYIKQLEGLKYSQLARNVQRRLDEFQFQVYIINAGTPSSIVENIYDRLHR